MDLGGEKLGRVAAEKGGAAGGTRDGCRGGERGGRKAGRGGSRMEARTLSVSRLLSENQRVMRLVQPVWRPKRENRRPLAASAAVARVRLRLGRAACLGLGRGRGGRGCGADGGRVSGAAAAPGGGGDSPPRATPPLSHKCFCAGPWGTPGARTARPRPMGAKRGGPMQVAASGAPRMAIERLSERKNGAPARAPKQGALRWRRH